ncbi:hypothetical protein CDD83_3785 [Cordyceps sp. RAO-2017]|nr:hypothetical protein CDD83_3785 [Cordyceps sp. RAO-2017]
MSGATNTTAPETRHHEAGPGGTRRAEEHGGRDAEAKIVFFGNEFPHDDLNDLFRRLHRHSKDRRFRLLAAFLDEATLVVKREIARLPQTLKDLLPHFDSVLTLVEAADLRIPPLGAAVQSALLIMLELGALIGYCEAEEVDFDLVRPGQTVVLTGLGVGLFAAAAVALSGSVADVVAAGAESVRLAFRLGISVDDVSRKVEAPEPDGTPLSWVSVVTGMRQEAVEEAARSFNAENGSPELAKVFVSAADRASVSVSGPASRVRAAFRSSPALRASKSLPLPVYDGLCHAPHFHRREDVEAALWDGDAESELLVPASRPVRLPLLSSRTGEPLAAATARELWLEIGTELLTGTIYPDRVTAGVVGCISGLRCRVDSFRTSLVLKGLLDSLAAELPHVAVERRDMIAWMHDDFGDRRPRTPAQSKLAIVGMACRLPGGANDPDLFWELLEQGRDVMTTVPPDRFDVRTHVDPEGKIENASLTPYGCFIDNPGLFDAGFFNMSPKEAEQTDPMQRLALVTAYEALEMAGFVPGRTASTRLQRVGSYYGQASDDWRELNASQNIGTYAVPGGERAFAGGRIHYVLKLGGPAFNIDTACSSGLAAVQAACSALWAGDVDTALAGGLNVITDPDNYAGLSYGHFLSRTGQCKVWDRNADGYCRADGIGTVVIKRLEDAQADNDNVLAVVLSAATNQSAEAISITHPHAGAQRDNYRQVMSRAGVDPLDVSYIELHGTGTQAGDAVESESVTDVFAPLAPRRRSDQQRLLLGAVKSNIGHGEAAAGIASLLKVLLSYQKGVIPAHIGIKTGINPIIPKDLSRRRVFLAQGNTAWPRQKGKKRLAVVNSFGAHGGNTTLLLEEAPERDRCRNAASSSARVAHPVAISARSTKSLQKNAQNLLCYLEQNPETDLADLSYTTCARRMHHSLRIATAASSLVELKDFLRSSLENKELRPIPREAPSVVLAFAGQGAYHRGMGRQLLAEFPLFREQVFQLDRLVTRLGFPSVLPAIGAGADDVWSGADGWGPARGPKLAPDSSPVLTQLSIVVLELALARLWMLLGVRPGAVIGHSLGEYTALAIAGVISAADALFLVGRRAQLLEERCTPGSHAMLAVRASESEIAQLLAAAESQASYEVSCVNSPRDTVLGGTRDAIEAIRRTLDEAGCRCKLLDLPFAFHTAQMDESGDVLDALEETARHVPFKAPSIPVLSPLLGRAVFDGKAINAHYLRRAARESVDFVAAVEAARDIGIVNDKTVWVDVGPHPVCAGFVRGLIPQARVVASCQRNDDGVATLAQSLASLYVAGLTPCWSEYFRSDEGARYTLLCLPKYGWNETNYWIPYIGTWTLDKAHLKHRVSDGQDSGESVGLSSARLWTSLVHHITRETIEQTTATLHTLSDMQHPHFLEALYGHKMNNCGVATSSIWTDMAFTVGDHLYRRLVPHAKDVAMNLADVEVLHAQVASKTKGRPQLLTVEARLDLFSRSMSLSWFSVDTKTRARAAEAFATGLVRFEDADAWRGEWKRLAHLILARIRALQQMADRGSASRLSRRMVYALFARLVDYADHYRGMHSVVLNGHEAVADVTLSPELRGTWHTPPQWIDSVSHLAGFVMNGGDAFDIHNYFYVTPGCESFRLAEPLEPGARYRSYVSMQPLPEAEAGNMFAGDVYILRGDTIIGMVGQIRFRRIPRLLMDRFFSAPGTDEKDDDVTSTLPASHKAVRTAKTTVPSLKPAAHTNGTSATKEAKHGVNGVNGIGGGHGMNSVHSENGVNGSSTCCPHQTSGGIDKMTSWETDSAAPSVRDINIKLCMANGSSSISSNGVSSDAEKAAEPDEPLSDGVVGQCLQMIAKETGLGMAELTAEATFVQLGVDSLMSLVLSEKFGAELGVEVKSSLFLECPTIGDFQGWLAMYV